MDVNDMHTLPPLPGSGAAGGATAFDSHFSTLYQGRWERLSAALAEAPDMVAFVVRGAGPDDFADGGKPEPYFLDSASVIAAEALVLRPGCRILDMCAAPGGKTLVIASRMDEASSLVANDLSAERRRRLAAVLDRHLPPPLRRRVRVVGRDGGSMCRSPLERYGAILLDAPCSSERHLMRSPGELARWTRARSRNLAVRQWALLASAFLMLEAGGCLVYSTCSISDTENDGTMDRLERKHHGEFRFVPVECPCAERTGYGSMIMPDTCAGAGPIYIARIVKNG